jgi:hypothetical protein
MRPQAPNLVFYRNWVVPETLIGSWYAGPEVEAIEIVLYGQVLSANCKCI